jgi:menaquinone reductase, molybdopterin-binding-like subunit
MDRRHFIKLTAITGTTAALTACGNPENQIIRFIPEDDLVPGVATFKPSICPLCAAGCGVIARVMEGDAEVFRKGQAGVIRMGLAKKLEGNPEDAISQGKLCPRGQAAIQVTYHPDRLDKPKKRSGERGSGQFVEITWEEAIKELTGKLDELAAANDQASLALLTKPRRGKRFELAAEVLQRFGAPAPVTYEFFSDEVRGAPTTWPLVRTSWRPPTSRTRSTSFHSVPTSWAPGIRPSPRAWPTGACAASAPARGRSSSTSTRG